MGETTPPPFTPQGAQPYDRIREIVQGIRGLGVLPHEHPHAEVYNEALTLAADYVQQVWSHAGRGALSEQPNADGR